MFFGLTLVAVGIASWFAPDSMYTGMRVCAMNRPSLIGVHVRIIDLDNGRTSTCVVVGTGPFVRERVIDVSPEVRDDLELLGPGTANVRVFRIPCWPQPTPQTCAGPPTDCRLNVPPPAGCR